MGDYTREDAKKIAELALELSEKAHGWKQKALAALRENTRLQATLEQIAKPPPKRDR